MGRFLSVVRFYYQASCWPEYLAPAYDLALRLFLADVFFKSGLIKVQTWDSTLYLFNEVYAVPLLPPEFAAYLATGGEMGLSVLLAIGLFGRFAAAGLSILNVVAVISYPELSESGLNQHLYWGLLLGVLLVLSRGAWSLDVLLQKLLGTWAKFNQQNTKARPWINNTKNGS